MKIIKNGGITSAKGFIASGVKCGIKASGKPDFALLVSLLPALSDCATTTNRFAAAPVKWCRQILAKGLPVTTIAVNSGCANAVTGKTGTRNAAHMAKLAATATGAKPGQVYVASTGVIGRQLPMDKISAGIRLAASRLSAKGGPDFARAIMTTDLVPKEIAVEFKLAGKTVRIGGCTKGSGMIHPNMATLLAFATTDAALSPAALKKAFRHALTRSFNRITVDGDTSTNDTLILLANGTAANRLITDGKPLADFTNALTFVLTELAKMVVKDGEGATKFVTIRVKGAKTEAEADRVGRTVAHSPLVKTALFGADPNWGRILCAVGYAGIPLNPDICDLDISGLPLVRKGQPLAFDKIKAHKVLKAPEAFITIHLHRGNAEAVIYTCDFSYDYVKINAEYTT